MAEFSETLKVYIIFIAYLIKKFLVKKIKLLIFNLEHFGRECCVFVLLDYQSLINFSKLPHSIITHKT